MTIPLLKETIEITRARQKWQYRGNVRPPFADSCPSGQESVWDFPRPPLIQDVTEQLQVTLDHRVVAATTRGRRVVETAGAPTYYFPPEDVDASLLSCGNAGSICEWKGLAQSIFIDDLEVGWRYIQMFPEFAGLYLWSSFYPRDLSCSVAGQRAQPQPGGYYGGWVTPDLAGPIKGSPGSGAW